VYDHPEAARPIGDCSLVFSGEVLLRFYGSMMLVPTVSGSGGCEVTALSNWLRGHDDQLGCPLCTPFDALDRVSRAQPATKGNGPSAR
jgi:hypothetical protein